MILERDTRSGYTSFLDRKIQEINNKEHIVANGLVKS